MIKIIKHYKKGYINLFIHKKIYGKRLPIFYQDMSNKIKYGNLAPLFAERIWVDPFDCRFVIRPDFFIDIKGYHAKHASGKVIDFSCFLSKLKPILEVEKIKSCINHWINNVPWEDTGIYEYMERRILKNGSADGCKNLDDIIKRYEKLDIIFNQIKKDGRLRTRKEINPKNFRELGGILIHIGPGGEPIFSYRGCHRIAIAFVLGLRFPAQIGCVHIDSISFLTDFRKKTILSGNN